MRRARTITVLVLLLAGAPVVGRAESFSISSAQLLYGGPFDDRVYGYNTATGGMATLSFEHYGTWGYGDNYMIVDVLFGPFVDAKGAPLGQNVQLYGEWGPRVALGRVLGLEEGLGFLKEVFVATQLNVSGTGFWGVLGGMGVDFNLPFGLVAGVNVYYRKDRFTPNAVQVSPYWELPLRIRWVGLLLRGYVDIVGSPAGFDVNSQPQLLMDLGGVLGERGRKIQLGVEWYFHHSPILTVHAPQLLLRWVW
ncbi:MAG: hypothetical protein AB2A00_11465 [Myxococcota bacterium]